MFSFIVISWIIVLSLFRWKASWRNLRESSNFAVSFLSSLGFKLLYSGWKARVFKILASEKMITTAIDEIFSKLSTKKEVLFPWRLFQWCCYGMSCKSNFAQSNLIWYILSISSPSLIACVCLLTHAHSVKDVGLWTFNLRLKPKSLYFYYMYYSFLKCS